MNTAIRDAIRNHISVPDHIQAIANAIRYDLMHGPSFLLIPCNDITRIDDDCLATFYDDAAESMEDGDAITETYSDTVTQALRDFIDDLPADLWINTDWDGVMTSEPEPGEWVNPEDIGLDSETDDPELMGYEVDDIGRVWCDNDMSSTYHVTSRDIVAALFGNVIAREFR